MNENVEVEKGIFTRGHWCKKCGKVVMFFEVFCESPATDEQMKKFPGVCSKCGSEKFARGVIRKITTTTTVVSDPVITKEVVWEKI